MLKGLIDVPIDVFGGYCPAIVPNNLPPGAANIAQDVMFPQAGVRTRGGLGAGVKFTGGPLPVNTSVNGLKSFLTSAGSKDLLIWDAMGNFWKEDPQGVLNFINNRPYLNLFYESQTLFGREYQAFFNALGGFDIPRQYDDTNWDRVSQVGPGASPVATDLSYPIVSISRAATTGIISIELDTAIAIGVTIGSLLTIDGVGADVSLNGTFPVASTGMSGGNFTATLWGAFGAFPINQVQRVGPNLNTATLSEAPNFTSGTDIIIGGVDDSSFDGGPFASTSVSGNQVMWTRLGATTISAGGTLYVQNFTAPIIAVQFPGYTGEATLNATYASASLVGDQAANFPAGGSIVIAGNSVAGNNGTFPLGGPPSIFSPNGIPGITGPGSDGPVTVVYYLPTSGYPTGAGMGGTATATLPASSPTASGIAGHAGNISAGLHQVSVAFITRQGYITKGAPPNSWVSQGNLTASLTGIATGPPNIAQRLLLFTPEISAPALTGTFYSLPNGSTALSSFAVMLIPDNVTTTATIDFEDAILISGFQAEYLFNQLELGESASMLGYNSRTCWLGERAKVPNFNNLTFDGGFTGALPNGWKLDAANGAGGSSAIAAGFSAVDWGDCYVITGNGSAIVGKITQSAYQDNLQVPIIESNTSYSVRVRVARTNGLKVGVLHINLTSASTGTTVGLTVDASIAPPATPEVIATLTAQIPIPPNDLVLQVYADGTPTLGQSFLLDSIEVFPTLTPFNSSIARFSYAFNPEGFDGVTGQVQVRPGDGQQLRAGFPLRNSLYLGKDHYLGYVTDDGVNEPSSWSFTEVSATVGICGPNAVDWNEEWAVFAERSGLYICWGSDPVKITQEIQYDATYTGRIAWNSINWSAAYTIWVRIDKVNKMILIGAPINGATSPNVVFMLDYQWLESAEDIAGSPLVGYSQFTGKMLAHGRGRRWAIWNITANSMTFAERADGSAQPFFGGAGNGTIFWQQDFSIQNNDAGAAINWQYQTYATPSSTEEQQYQLRAHRKLFGYLKFRAIGTGTMGIGISTAQRSKILRGYSLSLNPAGDGERPVNIHSERFFITFYSTGLGSCVQVEKLIPCLKKDSAALVRGVSA